MSPWTGHCEAAFALLFFFGCLMQTENGTFAEEYVFAEEDAAEETVVCETPTEYTDALEAPDLEGTSKFQVKRLMVFVPEGEETDSHGAISSIYYTKGGYYLFEYDSPSATKVADKAKAIKTKK